MTELSIIIVNYNAMSLLKNCIESIRNTVKKISYEIIVVDNASKDRSIDMIKEEFPKATLIENKENLGFAKANNQGIKIARGKYVMLLNCDTIVKDGAVDKMVNFIEKYPKIGMLGPRLLNDDGSIQPSVSTFPNLWYVFLRMFRLRKLFPQSIFKNIVLKYKIFGSTVRSYFKANVNRPLNVDFISGACMLVRREVINRVSMFDQNFFLYVEDFDICKRIKESGWKIYYYNHAEVIHFAGKSSEGTFRELASISYQSLYYYFRKHHGRLYELAVRFIVVSALLIRGGVKASLSPLKTVRGDNKLLKSYLQIIKNTITGLL